MSDGSAKSGQVTESIKCCWCGTEVRQLFTQADIDQGTPRVCLHCGQGLAAARVYNCNLQTTSYITAPGAKSSHREDMPDSQRKEIKLPRF